jgi:hypothetical protein
MPKQPVKPAAKKPEIEPPLKTGRMAEQDLEAQQAAAEAEVVGDAEGLTIPAAEVNASDVTLTVGTEGDGPEPEVVVKASEATHRPIVYDLPMASVQHEGGWRTIKLPKGIKVPAGATVTIEIAPDDAVKVTVTP